jgi:hypothetical protein
MVRPNNKCMGCSMCSRVTEYPTGVPVPVSEQYYQCLADVAYECLGGEGINVLE